MTLIAYVIQTINLVGALVAIGLIIVIARQYVVARLALGRAPARDVVAWARDPGAGWPVRR